MLRIDDDLIRAIEKIQADRAKESDTKSEQNPIENFNMKYDLLASNDLGPPIIRSPLPSLKHNFTIERRKSSVSQISGEFINEVKKLSSLKMQRLSKENNLKVDDSNNINNFDKVSNRLTDIESVA